MMNTPQVPEPRTILETQNQESANPSSVKQEFELRPDSGAYNAGTDRKQMVHEEYNSGRNLETITRALKEGRAKAINDEPDQGGKPFFVIGSGPSLDHSIEYLKDWHGGVICSPSQAMTLIYHEVVPTHIVALDPFEEWAPLAGIDWSKTRTKLVTHPGVWPDLIENWPNEILLYRQGLGREDSFYATTQAIMYSDREGDRNNSTFTLWIPTEIVVFACSPPIQLFVGEKIGYGTCFMAGLDFGYPHEKERFTTWAIKKPGLVQTIGNAPAVEVPPEWEKTEFPLVVPEDPKKQEELQLVKSDNGIWSTIVNLYYKRNMISAIRLYGKPVYTTDHGTINEMPFVEASKVVRTQGRGFRPPNTTWLKKTTDRYLARTGCFVIETEDKGHQFIESVDPEKQLYEHMVGANRKFVCGAKCGAVVQGQDATDHTDKECPNCHQGKLVRKDSVDIGKNMKRIRELMAWVTKHPQGK